jgi:hypothetical protein
MQARALGATARKIDAPVAQAGENLGRQPRRFT